MPQLDPTYFPSQLLWLALSFGLLFILLRYWALPQVTETIDKRQKTIDQDLEHATKLQHEIEHITKKCEIVLNKSRVEAHALLVQKTDEMKAFNHEKEKELAEKLNAHLKNTELKVQKAKNDAIGEIEKLVVDLSIELAERLTKTKFSEEIARETVAQNLKAHLEGNQNV